MPLIDDAEAPEGVDLWDPDDSDGLRGRIETNFQKSLDRYVNGTEFGGVRLQLKDMSYVDKEKFSLREQRDAKDKDRMLARRLRGTVELVDNVTNEVLDTRKNITLARVPYLTQRGTFINNGSEYAPISQSRLMPGAYARRRDNGEVEMHMNTRPGTGSAMRLSMHPETAEYRIRVGGADLHAYSFFHEMGVPDEELLRRWGPEVLEKNKAKFSKDVLDRAYNKMSPKWERDPALPREAKVAAITAALNRAQLAKDILRRNLGNLYSEKQASYLRTMRIAYDRIDDMQKQASQPFSPDLSYEQTLVSSQELDFDNWMAFGKSAAEFDPDFAPLELREEYNAKGGVGPRLAAAQDWPKKWLDDQDNQGWLQWFERYSDGRKSEHDEKQIARWLSFKRRQGAQFTAKPTPRRAFALRNWAIDPLKLLPQDHRAPFEEEMKRYKQQEFVKWYMRRHDFDDMAKHRLALKAKARGAPVAPELSAGDLISLAAEGYIQPKDLV